MGMTLAEVIARLESTDHYPLLFLKAFGSSAITEDGISKALAQFVRSIQSYQSKYDEGLENEFSNFSEQEIAGMEIFFDGNTRCNQCHISANFHLTGALNNGLDSDPADIGYEGVTNDPGNNGQFKVPSLRNVGVTGPYMHDGRFETLLEVIEHYNSGVQPHPYLDDRVTVEMMTGGTPYQLNMSMEDKAALVAFLHTLTDDVLLSDPKFSDPFP
ncbi:MAG: hypothetical protein HKN32_06195 [Flavobacteriales bacterium]|nr:hypothetical protein [Flavobacteriales bacterium]